MADYIGSVAGEFLAHNRHDALLRLPPKDFAPEFHHPYTLAVAALDSLVRLIRDARAASAEAVSWRGRVIGAAACGYSLRNGLYGVMTGANFKPRMDMTDDLHAEQVALAKVRAARLDTVPAIAVWADPDDPDSNRYGLPALPPCEQRCLPGMQRDVPEVSGRTLILSANSDFSVCMLYTRDELASYYQDPARTAYPGTLPLYSLADPIDDRAYTEHIDVPHIIPKLRQLYPGQEPLAASV